MPEIRFGPFALDPPGRKLCRGADVLPLPSRAVDVLAYLVARRDRVVDKDEIIAAVWHDVAVTDDSLIHAVSVIRRALGDDAAHPSFVETIPRRGYRFVGHVEDADAPGLAAPIDSAPASAPPPPRGSARVRQVSVAIAAAVVLGAVAGTIAYRTAVAGSGRTAAVSQQQEAPSGTTLVSAGVVSPTGRHLVLVAEDERTGRTALWLRAVDALEPQRIPHTTGGSKPFFSPDGRRIAFFVNGRLVSADLEGNDLRTIASVRGAPAGGDWGADGRIVFAEWTTGLSSVAAGGGAASPLTRLDHTALDVAHAWPQFLPGGRRVLYQIISPDPARAGIYVVSLDSGDHVRLLADVSAAAYVSSGYLLYVRNEMLMAAPLDLDRLRLAGRAVVLAHDVLPSSLASGIAMSASAETLTFRQGLHERQLTWVDRAGEPQSSLRVPTSMFNFRVSPDGRSMLAASSLTSATGVWLVDLAHRRSTHVAADGIAAIWSPNGGRLAYTSRGGLDVHVRPSAGPDSVEPLASDPSVKVLNDWSPGINTIVYTRHDAATLLDLWHVPASGGAGRPLLQTAFNEAQARVSSDGRWIAYMSDASGRPEVYVRRYPQLDEPRQISSGGGSQPQWRADRQELFYLAADRSLMAAAASAAADGAFGAPRRLFRAAIADSPSDARESYAAMPDGQSFLIDARREGRPAAITVMRDWAAGLTRPPGALAARHDASE